MRLGFTEIELVGLNCPYFLGIREHGQKASFDLDDDTCDLFKCYSECSSLHIHRDGTMYLSKMHYDSRNEEYVEEIFQDLTDNAEAKDSLDKWLKANPLYRSQQFPYPVSTKKDFWGCDMIADSLDSLIEYLKRY